MICVLTVASLTKSSAAICVLLYPRAISRTTSSSRAVNLKNLGDVPVAPLAGKVVIDTLNYYPQRDGHIADLDNEKTTTSEMVQEHLPTCDGPHGGTELLGATIFEEIPRRSCAHPFHDQLRRIEGREKQDAWSLHLWRLPANPLGRLDAIQQGHADIHQDHVGLVALRELHRDQPIFGLPDDFHVWRVFKDDAQPFPHQALIIRDQDADLRFAHDRLPFWAACSPDCSYGSLRLTVNPPVSAGPASTWPPSAWARSRIPWSP